MINHNMILSASGWRKVFAKSANENDNTQEIGIENTALAIIAADVLCEYFCEVTKQKMPVIVLGRDSRPTGNEIVSAIIKTLNAKKAIVRYTGVISAPEIMSYAKKFDGFIYISASHNPIGHNGIKAGLNNGGVLNAEENAKIVKRFLEKCKDKDAINKAFELQNNCKSSDLDWVYAEAKGCKDEAQKSYNKFIKEVISSYSDAEKQEVIFDTIKNSASQKKIGVVCDMNGSARSCSIDKDFFKENNIMFYSINDKAGEIVHEIIPEGKNLLWCANEIEKLQKEGHKDAILGYVPDCDGDRGNIVYWDEKQKKAKILDSQKVFALSVLAELSYANMIYKDDKNYKAAVAVNGATSMMIDEIAKAFNAKVFRCEVGEANVVNTARNARENGFTVRIYGEGSNGGNITYPSAVRDPLSTIFAIIKLLSIDSLFKTWCEKTNYQYSDNFTISDIISSLPKFITTAVSDQRALLHIKTTDSKKLKQNLQTIFEKEWKSKKATLEKKYNIFSYDVVITKGTSETVNVKDFTKSENGGLKILFFDKDKNKTSFMWMRPSGTEPVFRILCDVKGTNEEQEKYLVEWETKMIKDADK